MNYGKYIWVDNLPLPARIMQIIPVNAAIRLIMSCSNIILIIEIEMVAINNHHISHFFHQDNSSFKNSFMLYNNIAFFS